MVAVVGSALAVAVTGAVVAVVLLVLPDEPVGTTLLGGLVAVSLLKSQVVPVDLRGLGGRGRWRERGRGRNHGLELLRVRADDRPSESSTMRSGST